MSVPKFFEFFEGFLHAVQDENLHTAHEVREIIAQEMNISAADRAELLPSGKQSTFDNRVAWARTYLDKAGLIETPVRGKYKITSEGKKALASGEEINLKYLEKSKNSVIFIMQLYPMHPKPPSKRERNLPWNCLMQLISK